LKKIFVLEIMMEGIIQNSFSLSIFGNSQGKNLFVGGLFI
jgi:hypothetical protein